MTEITVTPADEAAARAFAEARKMGGLGDGISLAERFARHRHEARKAALDEAAETIQSITASRDKWKEQCRLAVAGWKAQSLVTKDAINEIKDCKRNS